MRPVEVTGQKAAASEARRATDVKIYRGLAHPQKEKPLYRRQLRTVSHTSLHGFEFFSEPLDLPDSTKRAVLDLYADPSSHEALAIKDLCHFHPDYAVVWNTGGNEHVLQICYGCHEWRYYGPIGDIRNGYISTDISEPAYFDRLTKILPKSDAKR